MTRSASACNIENGRGFVVASRRGTAVTELAMVAPIIVMFMTIAYGLWRLTITEHDALALAQNATNEKSVRFMTMGELEQPPDYVAEDRTPRAADVPILNRVNERTLRAFSTLPNMAAHAGGAFYMEQMTEISADFGGFNLARDGMVVRPSWTLTASRW